jgi:hypothetical protein
MSALGDVIDCAVASVIAEHPKFFNLQTQERARKTLVREIVKSLVREVRDVGDEQSPAAPVKTVGGLIASNDSRAIAYCNLREIAGAVRPQHYGSGQIYLPPEAETTAVRAFAELPPRKEWPFISDRRQLTAWSEFFEESLPSVSRRQITETRGDLYGAQLPWLWPPSKTGKIYEPGAEEEIAP